MPTSENGSARLGIVVADKFRKNRKMTMITRKSASSSVNFTSSTELRIVMERSNSTHIFTEGGSAACKRGSMALMPSTTCTAFVPGCLKMTIGIAIVPWGEFAS